MKRAFLLLPILWGFIALFQSVSAQVVHPHYVDGALYWRVKPGVNATLSDSILQRYAVVAVEHPFAPLNPNKLQGNRIIADLQRTVRIRFTDAHAIAEFASYLAAQHSTELVERVPLVTLDLTPNDPQFASQWHLATINASNAWNLSVGNPNVTVAIVDDAVRSTHQDLAPSIWTNPGENPFNALDDDGNGYINDIHGWDVADNDNNPDPPLAFATSSVYTHGTHCAGIAAAATNNATGVASIGFGVKIIPVKCNNDATPGPSLPNAYDGVVYAISVLPDVMSLSWGGPAFSNTNQLLFDLAATNDIVVVAAAGNSNVSTPMYPASYNHVISVAATGPTDAKASFSNYGPTIDISAPGVDILSTLAGSNSDYGILSGTSMACPMVAGLAALMRSYNPAKTALDIESCITSTADNINAQNPGYIGQLGAGRINAFQALQCVSGTPVANFTQNYTQVCPGFQVQFTDQSYGSPTSWAWTFPGGTPGTSTAQNPLVTYNTPGTYSVTLTATSPAGSNTYTFNSIVVATPTATISGGGLINLGSPAIINVTFTGAPPFSFVYTDGSTNYTVTGIQNTSHSFTVSPSVTTNYTLVSMSSAQCSGTVSGNALVTVSNGCAANINFQKLMGGAAMDNPTGVRQTPDCGYVVVGNTFSYGTGNYDAVLTRLDPYGNLLWFKTFGDAADDTHFYDVVPVSNGYVCVGSRAANNQGRLFLVKTDLNGNLLWHQTIQYTSGGGAIFCYPAELVEMANGDLTIAFSAGHTNFNSSGQGMLRLSGVNGSLIWSRHTQVNSWENMVGIQQLSNGNLVGSGYSRSTGVTAGLYDMSLTQRDGSGNLVWSRNYGSTSNDFAMDNVTLPDGGQLVVGYTQGFSASVSDIVILRTNSTGALVWSRKYARPAADIGYKIVAGCNGKYFVAGSSRTPGAENDALLFQIDLNGNVLWAKTVGGVLDDGNQVGLARTGDCGCVLTSSTFSYGYGESDYHIIKTDSLGTMDCHSSPVTLTVTAISPSTFVANTVNGNNAPSYITYNTTALTHTPSQPDSVCTACGAPIADFDYVTNAFSFTALDNSVNAQNWYWDFGDGSPVDTLRLGVHEYAGPGTYTVTLIVTSACGADTAVRTVTITGLSECLHVMQPGPVRGFDTWAFSRDDATNNNYGSHPLQYVLTWTWSGNPGTGRGYMRFDLSRICNTASLLEARFSASYNSIIGQAHSGTNNAWLRRVTTPWDEYSLTWLNQPVVTTVNQVAVPTLTGPVNLTNLLVTPLFQNMITGPNYGFQWLHNTEATYRSTIFVSSDWQNPVERPRLTLRFDPIYAYSTAQPSGNHSVTICPGDSIQLNAAGYTNSSTTSGPSTAIRYLWVPATGLSCTTCPNPMASPDSTITYRAIVYNCPSCADIDTVRVNVSQVWVEAPNAILCAGDTAQMIANHPVPGSTFLWTPTNTLSPANSQTPNAYPTVPTWYYVTATDPINNCVSVDSALVLTGYPSTLPPLIPDTLISCNQGTITFPLNPNFTPVGNDFYEWNLVGNITPDPNHPSSDAIINTNVYPATYHFVLQVTNEFGCITKDSVDVNVNCTVLPTAVSLRGEALPAGNLLTWHVDAGGEAERFTLERSGDGLSFTAVTQVDAQSPDMARDYDHLDVAPPDGDMLYRVRITDRDGQAQYTESVLLHRETGRNVALFPNPTSGRVTIVSGESFAGATLQVMNAMGQCVLKQPGADAPSMELDLKGLAAGAYMLEIRQGGSVTHLRVVVR